MPADKKKKKRMRSTVRNLHGMWLMKLFSLFIVFDMVTALSFCFLVKIYADRRVFGPGTHPFVYLQGIHDEKDPAAQGGIKYSGEILSYKVLNIADAGEDPDNRRGYEIRLDLKNNTAEYIFYENGQEAGSSDITYAFRITVWMAVIIVIFEVIYIFGYMINGAEPIRYRLRPLNEMSEDAFKISTMPFDEEKIHDLETAISRITPDGPGGRLKTDDEELKGLEAAVNAMIERLRDSYKQQARFVSDASHELRTPIAVIKGYADMLDRWGKRDEKILEESIEAIRNESDHMNELIEQLLFLARGDSGRQPVNISEISLYDMVKEVYEESLMIDEHHIYEFRGEAGVKAMADISMLKQSARILVDNASKYTQEKEHIVIGCFYNEDGRPAFYVQDNGMGMNEADVKHVFERFYRSDSARYKKEGNGLGLSIAKWIVDRHGGHFEILSREDIGTRITVVL